MLDVSALNYWAIIVASLVNVVVGTFWYSPIGFGKIWTSITGIDMMKMPKNQANTAIVLVALGAIVQTAVLAVTLNTMKISGLGNALVTGVVLWAGFVAATALGDTLYARRGWKLWCLNSSFFLLVLAINSVILTTWR